MEKLKLYPFQEKGVEFLMARDKALLACDMGTGKSCQVIVAAEQLGLNRILVICPASVKTSWAREIAKWADPSPTVQIIEGKKPTISEHSVYTIVNYDLLSSKSVLLPLLAQTYDLLVCDEAHYLKNLSAKRTKCVYFPKALSSKAKRIWLLTGTPVLNRPVELYPHLKSLIPERLGPYASYTRYAHRYCGAYEGKWGMDVSGATNLPELSNILSTFMLRREKKDVLKDLPEKTYQNIYLPKVGEIKKLSVMERREYEKNKEGILGELASIRRKSGLLKVPGVLEHVRNILEEKEKIVLFAYHRDVIKALADGLAAYSPVTLTGDTPSSRRQEAVDKFKEEKTCRVFIGQIEAAGVGINGLQDVCDTVVFAEITWVPGQIHQAIDRCHRIGQKNAVLVQFLIVEGSIDEDILATVARKTVVIGKIVKPTSTTTQEKEDVMGYEITVKFGINGNNTASLGAIGAVQDIAIKHGGSMRAYSAVEVPDMIQPVKIEAVPEAPVTTMVKEEPKKVGRPKKEEKKQEENDFSPAENGPIEMTAQDLLKYCNSEISKIGDKTTRTAIVKKVVAAFKEAFGVESIANIPADKVVLAHRVFEVALGRK